MKFRRDKKIAKLEAELRRLNKAITTPRHDHQLKAPGMKAYIELFAENEDGKIVTFGRTNFISTNTPYLIEIGEDGRYSITAWSYIPERLRQGARDAAWRFEHEGD